MKTINIYDLEVDLQYEIFPEEWIHTGDGAKEFWPKRIELFSVNAKGLEIITLLEQEQIAEIEEKLLEANQD